MYNQGQRSCFRRLSKAYCSLQVALLMYGIKPVDMTNKRKKENKSKLLNSNI